MGVDVHFTSLRSGGKGFKVADILGGFVRDAAYVVLKNQHGGGAVAVGSDFLNVDYGAVGDAADLNQPIAALALDFGDGFSLAAEYVISGYGGADYANQQ